MKVLSNFLQINEILIEDVEDSSNFNILLISLLFYRLKLTEDLLCAIHKICSYININYFQVYELLTEDVHSDKKQIILESYNLSSLIHLMFTNLIKYQF